MTYTPKWATEQNKQELKTFIHETKDTAAKDRARAVLARTEGKLRAEIAAVLCVKIATISDWITWYRQRGIDGLRSKPQLGNHKKLTRAKKEEVATLILSQSPKEAGFTEDFWSVPVLASLLKRDYGVSYKTDRSYHQLFEIAGFSYHKPDKQDKKRDETKVAEFEERLRKKGAYIRKILSSL